MDDLIKQIKGLRPKCENYSNMLEQKYGTHDPRVHCINNIHKHATMACELLSYYKGRWSQIYSGPAEEIEEARRQNGERCMMLLRWMFVATISVIEFDIKETLKLYPKNPLVNCCNRSKKIWECIGKKSLSEGIMTAQDAEIGIFIIETRNCIVHNNAVADETNRIQLSQRVFTMTKGQMMHDNLDILAIFTNWLADWFFSWCQKIELI